MIKLLAEHRVAANLAMIMMILAGIWAVKSIPSQLDPPMNYPQVWVSVEWRGASAEDLELLVTLPIEQQMKNLQGLKEVSSRTSIGFASIGIQFDFDADMTQAMDQVKQRVASIRNFPADIEPPMITRRQDLEDVAVLTITGPGTIDELIPIVRAMEEDLLDRGIERISFDGLPVQEIALSVGGIQLHELGLTLDEIADQVAQVSQNVPAGSIGRGQGTHQLRSLDQERDVGGFEQLIIEAGNQLIRFDSIGTVQRRPQDGQPSVERYGQPAIAMSLFRATASDAFLAEKIVQKWLSDIKPTLPPGVEVSLVVDVWDLLGAQLNLIVSNGLSGLVLVIGILFLFLNGRVGSWVTIGIPVSFLLGLALFHGVFGHGISIIALLAFIMAIGIVVDDAIVVGEDVVTHFEEGMTPAQAAVAGAQRMWVPVMTSSLTTMAAFIPLLLIGGSMGDMILVLPTALLCIIVASLVECFLVLPGHLRHALEKVKTTNTQSFRNRFDRRFIEIRDKRFMPLVNRVLMFPGTTFATAIGAMMLTFALVGSGYVALDMKMGFSFESIEANVEFSSSATQAQRDSFLKDLEDGLSATNIETNGVNLTGWLVNKNLAKINSERKTGIQFASVQGQYVFEEDRSLSPKKFVEAWREKIAVPVFVEQFILQVAGGSGNGRPDITFVLNGSDLDSLKEAAEELAAVLASHAGVSNVLDDLPYGKEQLIFSLTSTGRSLGITSQSLGRQLRAAYSGRRVQIFNENDVELEVIVVLPDSERDSLAKLQQLPVQTPSGDLVALANIATLYNRRGIDTIRHRDSKLAISVSATVDSEVNNTIAITNDIKANSLQPILDKYDVQFGLGGRSEQDRLMLETMSVGALLTLVFIYLILAWVFASYLWPLAIMMAIPFGLVGAIVGHFIMGMDIGPMSMLAFFSLTGIVVNDSIVLISFLKRDVDAGKPLLESLVKSVRSRFRAVFLTSITTVAGLTPLLFGGSTLAMYTKPIAVTICFGLSFATLLVLLVIPALIILLEKAKSKSKLMSIGGYRSSEQEGV
ncbi:MAG: multidrug efflux pump subunit AcrB [Gammaproteobacteria bacterium]|jgi:multidrug efflux pump subunit AcrB